MPRQSHNHGERGLMLQMLGRRVRAARSLAGLSQKELAAMLGTTQNVVSRIESWNSDPTYTTLQKISRLLGVSIDALQEPVPEMLAAHEQRAGYEAESKKARRSTSRTKIKTAA